MYKYIGMYVCWRITQICRECRVCQIFIHSKTVKFSTSYGLFCWVRRGIIANRVNFPQYAHTHVHIHIYGKREFKYGLWVCRVVVCSARGAHEKGVNFCGSEWNGLCGDTTKSSPKHLGFINIRKYDRMMYEPWLFGAAEIQWKIFKIYNI